VEHNGGRGDTEVMGRAAPNCLANTINLVEKRTNESEQLLACREEREGTAIE